MQEPPEHVDVEPVDTTFADTVADTVTAFAAAELDPMWLEHEESARWQLEDTLKTELRDLEPSARVERLQQSHLFWSGIDAPDVTDTGLTRDEYCQLLQYACDFFKDVEDTDEHGQQNWRAALDSNGYGVDYRMPWTRTHAQRRAPKIIWILLEGPVSPGLLMRHACEDLNNPQNRDYRKCCNLMHLSPGTPAENAADTRDRGRLRRARRMTDAEREQILELYDAGTRINQIAKVVGRDRNVISNLLRQENVRVKRGRCPALQSPEVATNPVESEIVTAMADSDVDSTNGTRQTTVPHTDPLLPPRAGCTAPIKWVGGKRWLVPTIAPSIYERLGTTRGRYIEPFMGSGAVALDLGLPGMILGDVCRPLVSTYQTIRKSPEAVAWALKTLVDRGTDKESYLAVRASNPASVVFAAARFIYLNKFGFNGLYRENSKGQFNVPHGGDRSSAGIPDVEILTAVANALKEADLRVVDFRDTIARAQEGDVVYVDSPYYETFSDYTAGGFTDDDHFALSSALIEAHNRGAVIIASNSDHERVRELYAWAHVVPVHERHAVGATGDRRGLKPAVLILSDETILRGA